MNNDREFALRMFFNEIISISHRTDMLEEGIKGGGYPLSGLVNNLLSNRSILNKIVSDYTGEMHEFRLNGAGFKLWWRFDRNLDFLKIHIGGDQACQYPNFVDAVNKFIENNRFLDKGAT